MSVIDENSLDLNMSADAADEDEQLRLALQLSRESYEAEQRQRENRSPALMLGDPNDIQRKKNMDEIEALFDSTSSCGMPPHLQPGSTATLPYGFRPEFTAANGSFGYININTVLPFPQPSTSNSQLATSLSSTHPIQSSASFPSPLSTVIPPPPPPHRCLRSSSYVSGHSPSTPKNNNSIKSSDEHSPIIVPFRTQYGNFIDLDDIPAAIPPANNVSITETPQDVPELQLDAILALIPSITDQSSQEGMPKPEDLPPSVPDPPSPRPFEGSLELVNCKSSFTRQCDDLRKQIEEIKKRRERNVFFIAPTVDYQSTTADSIKLKVHRDETWPASCSGVPEHVELTYDVSSTCEDLLIAVLCRMVPPEDVGTTVLIEDYTLKIYGVDEFLEPSSILGMHPVVGRYVSRGKDVPLQIGRKVLRDVNFHFFKDMFEIGGTSRFKFPCERVEKCLSEITAVFKTMDNTKDYTTISLQTIADLLIELSKCCLNIQTFELFSAIKTLLAADIESHYMLAKNMVFQAVTNMVAMFCEATACDKMIASALPATNSREIRESGSINDELMVYVESMHNLPSLWFQKYQHFYVEICIMHGTVCIGSTHKTDQKYPVNKNRIVSVPFSSYLQLQTQVMLLPRESQLCVIVFGISKNTGSEPVRDPRNNHETIAFATIPVFDYDGFLVQGKVALPLKNMNSSIVQPWGPRPLIQSKNEAVMVLSFVEYQFKVEFPRSIEQELCVAQSFSSIIEKDKLQLLDILEGHVSPNNLSNDDRQLLWSSRKALFGMPGALVAVLASAVAWDRLALCNIYPLLNEWTVPQPQLVLDLLLPYFQDTRVREKAVTFIKNGSSDFLIGLIPQFIEALRFELFESSALAEFLLERCTRDRRFATTFFWELEHRALNESAPYSTRCCFLLELVLDLGIPNFAEDISCQKHFLKQLDDVCSSAKEAVLSNANSVVQSKLYDINDKVMVTGLRLPINPGFFCTSISVEDCGVFNSLTRPLRLSLIGQRSQYGVIYKVGDDLRQDAIVLQLVRLMNDMWLRENLDLRMLTYRVLPTGKNKGLIELVNDCRTLREVQVALSDRATDVFKDNGIADWISRHNPSEFNYRTAFDNFKRSCAGWCVATYVLGIGDRHNDNILISTSGHVFHIDFGKYMGDWQTAMGINRDRVPFVLTPEMVYAINSGSKATTDKFQEFADYCCKAFNILRRNCGLLLNVIKFMSCSSVPNMNVNSVNFVEKNLMLGYTNSEAASSFTQMIRASMDSSFVRINFLAHTFAQMANNGGVSHNDDKGSFSFTTEIYTAKTDGRIRKINVINYEKWRNPDKVYMYQFEVHRLNEKLPNNVYRSFEEVQQLYRALAERFTAAALPVFDSGVGFGRSNTRQVAAQRRLNLQNFFSRFFELADEITQSELVYTFFHAIHRDTDPEVVKDTISNHQFNNEPTCLHLSLSVEQHSSVLKIFISHARNLPLIGGVSTTLPDSYVKIYVRPDRLQNSKRKTDIVKNTVSPTYNFQILYNFDSQNEMRGSILDVSIWHSSSAIVRDNYRICGTLIPIEKLFEAQPDRKGTRNYASWFTLPAKL